MSIDHCDFCDEFVDGKKNRFVRIYGPELESRILFRSTNFAVLPSLGQIVEGYLLIVPMSHHTAMADMPAHITEELLELCERVRLAQSQVYGPSLFFEHGVRGTQAGGCGVDHAHVHVVPFTGPKEPIEVLKRTHSFKPIGGISEIHKKVAPNSPYVYFEQTNGQAWVCEIDFIPSQYLRKILAESMGINSWDWRECGREQALLNSITRLSESFRGDLAVVPEALEDCETQTALAAAVTG